MNQRHSPPPASSAVAGPLYTLSEIAAETGIAVDDLARYRQRHGDRIPTVVEGERRRYPQEAVELFRALHRERRHGDDGRGTTEDEGAGRRRLMSLAAQRRRRDEEQRRQREKRAAEPVVDPGPPDPMIAALEAMSGVAETARAEPPDEAEDDTVSTAAPTARPESSAEVAEPPAESPRTAADDGPVEPPTADVKTVAELLRGTAGEALGGERAEVETGDSEGSENTADTEDTGDTETVVRTVARQREPVRERTARPARPVYTLQEVHERTGIPYAKLALYAASHADQIPSVGERRSPAYMREGMEAFCRLHALKEPSWEIPELGPEPGWDDARGLAARLQALETAQQSTAEKLRGVVRSLRRPWNGQAVWE